MSTNLIGALIVMLVFMAGHLPELITASWYIKSKLNVYRFYKEDKKNNLRNKSTLGGI